MSVQFSKIWQYINAFSSFQMFWALVETVAFTEPKYTNNLRFFCLWTVQVLCFYGKTFLLWRTLFLSFVLPWVSQQSFYFQLWHIQIYCLKLTCWSTLKFPIYIYGSGCIVLFKYWLISMSCMPDLMFVCLGQRPTNKAYKGVRLKVSTRGAFFFQFFLIKKAFFLCCKHLSWSKVCKHFAPALGFTHNAVHSLWH